MRIVKTENGLIEGLRGNNPLYTVFKGIPYAKAPIGDLRWKAPQPHENWDGVYKAYEYQTISVQEIRKDEFLYGKEFFEYTEQRGEDCLYLNVFTPAKSNSERLPVLFWVHGGGFFGGSGSEPEFDGEGFCKRGVILVTMNYRLGPLGFMAHPELSKESESGTSGNYGILDQIAALKWVRRNIAAFGGDPDNITIDGQSAGGMSIQVLCCSPLCRGDFHRAIIQSGISPIMRTEKSVEALKSEREKIGLALMRKLGCRNIEEMRRIPAEYFARGMSELSGEMVFSPYADGYVLPQSTDNSVLDNTFADVDLMVGCTTTESLSKDDSPVAVALRTGYLSFLEEMFKHGRKVYTYLFSRNIPGENGGAFHAGELWYQFSTIDRCWRPMIGKDYDVSNIMADYWAEFARCGNPTEEWIPADNNHRVKMEIGENNGMIAI